jgi:hypothetical protein
MLIGLISLRVLVLVCEAVLHCRTPAQGVELQVFFSCNCVSLTYYTATAIAAPAAADAAASLLSYRSTCQFSMLLLLF